jgi:hypothetical protein
LMARSGLTRHIHLDSWVSCVPDTDFLCIMAMLMLWAMAVRFYSQLRFPCRCCIDS